MSGMPKESMEQERIVRELQRIFGEKNATAAKHVRYAYSYDMSFVTPKLPDYVVMAETVEQIQELMRFANQEKIPVIPYTAGTNIGGLCIPERGGILLDLKRMNKIIKIDPESHYAVIEPGVSHGQLAEALFEHKLRFGWPVGPPSASVSSCAISHGIGGVPGTSMELAATTRPSLNCVLAGSSVRTPSAENE